MKKLSFERILISLALIGMQTACNSGKKQADSTKLVVAIPMDTLKTYIEVTKMEAKAYTMIQPGYYDSALARYNSCLSYLNTALQESKNKGLYMYANEFIQINQGLEAIYDSLKEPENSIKYTLECLKWAKLIRDYSMQVKIDMKTADKLKNLAKSKNDTAGRGTLYRRALQYALASGRVMDSLKTNDMDDLRYSDFHLISKIYTSLGQKKQANIYDKKYKDLYFRIFSHMPTDN